MKTTVQISVGSEMGTVKETIYGQFIKHILTCIERGIYDPASPFVDETGACTDVLEKAKELTPPALRFLGGTIMCQYRWEDSIGLKEKRIIHKNLIRGGELNPST